MRRLDFLGFPVRFLLTLRPHNSIPRSGRGEVLLRESTVHPVRIFFSPDLRPLKNASNLILDLAFAPTLRRHHPNGHFNPRRDSPFAWSLAGQSGLLQRANSSRSTPQTQGSPEVVAESPTDVVESHANPPWPIGVDGVSAGPQGVLIVRLVIECRPLALLGQRQHFTTLWRTSSRTTHSRVDRSARRGGR